MIRKKEEALWVGKRKKVNFKEEKMREKLIVRK